MIELILVILIVALANVPIIDLILVTFVVMLAFVAMRQRNRLRGGCASKAIAARSYQGLMRNIGPM
jgi:hypothetical protein